MLAHCKVAFVAESEREATPGDLLVGVMICSIGTEKFEKVVSHADFKKSLNKWGQRIGFFEPRCYKWPLIGAMLKKILEPHFAESDFKYLNEQMEAFQKYIVEGSRAPEFWDESPDSKISASHWSHSVEVILRGALGWSDEEINTKPLSKALWDYFKHCENIGLVRLISAEEAKMLSTPLTPEQAKEAQEQAEKTLAYMRQQQAQANG